MFRHIFRDLVSHIQRWLGDRGLRQLVSPVVVTDNVRVAVHDVDTLREEFPDWDDLDSAERARRVREVDPVREIIDHNTAVDDLNQYIVDNLDQSQAVNKDATHLAVGDDNTTPSTGNSSLNNRIGTFSISDESDNGKDLFTSTFLDTSQANGNDLQECGLKTASSGGTLLNHSTFSSISKTSNKTVTIDVTLEFRAA